MERPESSATKEAPPSTDIIEKQLQKVKADISVWHLMQNSFEHRQALLSSLMKMNTFEESTLDELVGLVASDWRPNAITFTEEDLPPFGPNHNLALSINAECKGKLLSITLIDEGSAVNVFPLSTLLKLNIPEKT